MSMPRIAVIGVGVVGDAVAYGFRWKGVETVVEVDPRTRPGSSLDDVKGCSVAFVCVPTPTWPDGTQNDVMVYAVLDGLERRKFDGIVAVKSTLLPTTARKVCKLKGLRVVVNPEFLTARNAREEFKGQTTVVVGAAVESLGVEFVRFMLRFFPETSMAVVSPEEASLVKYAKNVGWAIKVAAMNEFERIAVALGADWARVKACLERDPRIASEHLSVPGPDGHRGFGGACFPKDLVALRTLADKYGCPADTMRGAWQTNAVVRDEPELFERWPVEGASGE